MIYCAVIADIVDSKKIDNRGELQNKLISVLDALNQNSKNLVSPYTVTLGDEFQAVCRAEAPIISDIITIMKAIYPVKLRVAVGTGIISTKINSSSAIGMDGPAFYSSRDGITEMKKQNFTNIQFFAEKADEEQDLINKMNTLVFSMMDKWKPNTFYTFEGLLRTKSIKEIQSELKISERAVYKLIETHNLNYYTDYFETIISKIGKV